MNELEMTAIGRHQIDCPEARQQVLDDLAAGYTVAEAALHIGATSGTLNRWCQEDPDFKAAYDAAYQDSTDVLEKEARVRALDRDDSQSAGLLKFLIAGRRARWGRDAKEPAPVVLAPRPPLDSIEVARRISYLLDEGKRKMALLKAEGKLPQDEEL